MPVLTSGRQSASGSPQRPLHARSDCRAGFAPWRRSPSPLDDTQRVLLPENLNPDCANHQHLVIQMQRVDLDGDQVQLRQVGGRLFIEFCLRQCLEAPGCRGFRQATSCRRRRTSILAAERHGRICPWPCSSPMGRDTRQQRPPSNLRPSSFIICVRLLMAALKLKVWTFAVRAT